METVPQLCGLIETINKEITELELIRLINSRSNFKCECIAFEDWKTLIFFK